MKKMLALLLALMMALSCFGAVAEETGANEVSFELPALTVSYEIKELDQEAILNLLPMFGVGEDQLPIVQAILPVLAGLSEKLVVADNGVQFDLGLKGQNVLTLAGEQTEDGFAVASDILPSYVLTLSNEAIMQLMEQFMGQAEEAMAGVDMEKLAENVTTYIMEYVQVCMGAVTMGEPEKGEFAFEDPEMTFNTKTPITVDTEALKTGIMKLIGQFKSDEQIASLFSALGTMGVELPAEDEEINVIMPEIVCNAYSNVDDEGNEDGVVYVVTETVTTVEEESLAVNVYVLVDAENGVSVEVDVPDQQVNVYFMFTMTEDGAALGIDVNAMGMYFGVVANVTMGDAIVIDADLYFMNDEKPILSEQTTITFAGERTFTVLDESKTAVDLLALFNEFQGGEGELMNGLMADVMGNGLNALLAKAMQAMPQEIGAIMTLLTPATEAVEGAAE